MSSAISTSSGISTSSATPVVAEELHFGLLAQLQAGYLHAAVVHQVPALAAMEGLAWEPLRRGRMAVLASPDSALAYRDTVTLSELREERFLVNPRSLAPAAFEGLKLMCREFGGFDAFVLESAVTSTAALDTDWRPVRDGTAIALMAESTARAVCPADVAVVPVKPPPQYVLALAWNPGQQRAAVHRFLSYLRSYGERHAWLAEPVGYA
jgi:LysR substrate binding domain